MMASKKKLKRKIEELEQSYEHLEKLYDDVRGSRRDYANAYHAIVKALVEHDGNLLLEVAKRYSQTVTITGSNGEELTPSETRRHLEAILKEANQQNERKALEQSHKQYQDLLAKIIALMIDELGEDIVRVFVDEHEQPDRMAHWGE